MCFLSVGPTDPGCTNAPGTGRGVSLVCERSYDRTARTGAPGRRPKKYEVGVTGTRVVDLSAMRDPMSDYWDRRRLSSGMSTLSMSRESGVSRMKGTPSVAGWAKSSSNAAVPMWP